MTASQAPHGGPPDHPGHDAQHLHIRRLGIDTHDERIVYMREDCEVCRSEGFQALARVRIEHPGTGRSTIATLNVVRSELLSHHDAGLSEAAWGELGGNEGDVVLLSHPEPLRSMSHVRAKVYGEALTAEALQAIVRDVVRGRYASAHIASFLTACAGDRLDLEETVHLTEAMIDVGERLAWESEVVVDKHSVGGLPGNRTTPIVVAIAAANGLTMPKTSSRAITSPAGTADTMETLTNVELDLDQVRAVVRDQGGCLVWGGAVRLSPADDILIRVERALDLDSEGQLVASVLSKKAAAGSTHVVIDMPVGPTAKVRSAEAAAALGERLRAVGERVGLHVRVVETDGTQPVGRGVGPALEARDVLAVLRGETGAPDDLRERALLLAGHVLELGGAAPDGAGTALARETLADGRAWKRFEAICKAQGGLREPPVAAHTHAVEAHRDGVVRAIDNRRLARVAKLAGAPDDAAAGVELHVRLGARVRPGDRLFTVHAESPGELAYALQFVQGQPGSVEVG